VYRQAKMRTGRLGEASLPSIKLFIKFVTGKVGMTVWVQVVLKNLR